MKILTSIIVFLFLSFQSTSAQSSITQPNEMLSIQNIIEAYFEGWMTGDTSLIGSAMHSTCELKVLRDGAVTAYSRSQYLGFFQPRPRRENSGGRIVSIDITGPVASAKCEIETPERLYTDYFNMMKVADHWFIVDKISTNVAKTE